MPVEIEIKLKIDDLATVRDRLNTAGAKRAGERLETNIFFDTPERTLLGSDCGLRIRRQRDIQSGDEKCIITYKGPRGEGAVKRREEIETHVDNLDNAQQLLGRLGYEPQLSFEKRRESWRLDSCTIELDTLPEIGTFVEIEGATEGAVMRLRDKLALADLAVVSSTYADLVTRHLSDIGVHRTSLEFST